MLIAVPKGHKYIEVTHIGEIRIKAIKDLPNGSKFSQVIFDEVINTPPSQ